MIPRLLATALIPISLAGSIALTSCSSDKSAHVRPGGQATRSSEQNKKAASISFNFSSEEGFRYRFTGTSAFYNATGDPNYPMEEALPPGLTYLVLYGKLTNLTPDRPAPNPTDGIIKRFGGIVIPAQKKKVRPPRDFSVSSKIGAIQTCAWTPGRRVSKTEKYDLDTDGLPDGNKNYDPSTWLSPVKNIPNLCTISLGLNIDNYPTEGIAPNSSYPLSVLCIIPDNTPKNSVKFAVWRDPSEQEQMDFEQLPTEFDYKYVIEGSIHELPWSPVPKLGNS